MKAGFMTIDVRGSVVSPGTYEAREGELLGDVILSKAGGLSRGGPLKALLPGGALSVPLDCGEAMSARLGAGAVAEMGSSLGDGPMIVISGDECIVKAMQRSVSDLVSKCRCERSSCAGGVAWIDAVLGRLASGASAGGAAALLDHAAFALGQCAGCDFSLALSRSVAAAAAKFRREIARHDQLGGCAALGCAEICAW